MSKVHNTHRARWQRLRKKVLNNYKHICCNPFNLHNNIITPASEVHHILPAEDYPTLFFDINNLLPLCSECHKYAHKLLRSNPLRYYSYFAEAIKGVHKSLELFTPSPNAALLPQIFNKNGVDFVKNKEKNTKCFYDENKRKYFCACFRQYRQYPCSKCSH